MIGDRAIDAQLGFAPGLVHDLGSLWHEWTGHDMVYAVWAVRRDVLAANPDGVREALEALVASRAWGYANPEPVIAAAQAARPRPAGFYAAYYATLNFEFDGRARAGLGRFAGELAAIGAIAVAPAARPGGRSLSLADVLDRAAAGGRLSFAEGVRLYREAPLHELGAAAHARRMSLLSDERRHLRDRHDDQLHERLQRALHVLRLLPAREVTAKATRCRTTSVLARVKFAADQGATQIMIQGGVNPELRIELVRAALSPRRRRVPGRRHPLALGLGDQRPREGRGHDAARGARAPARRRA